MSAELVIRGGKVIDGTGAPAARADVAIDGRGGGELRISIAPTRPDHHEVIARTLENVEDMNFETLNAGIPWDFSTFPEYLDSVERRGLGMNFCAYIGTPLSGSSS